MKTFAALVICLIVCILALIFAQVLDTSGNTSFHRVGDYQFQSNSSLCRILIFTTKDTVHNDFYIQSKDKFYNGTHNDMIFFFKHKDDIPEIDTLKGFANINKLIASHPVAIWFGDSNLIINPDKYYVPPKNAWADTTTIYTPKQ